MKRTITIITTVVVFLVSSFAALADSETKSPQEMFSIGKSHLSGHEVEQDFKEAVRWFRKGAEQGYAPAQNELGDMYYDGQGVQKNFKESVRWFKKAAEQGYALAQNNLGDMFYYGQGVEQNSNEAVLWYRKAAEQGHAMAQHNLGFMYENGIGVNKKFEEAAVWFRKAAEQGYAPAQNRLGDMYYYGQDVYRDDRKAVQWFRKAAEQGYAMAQENLGFMYKNGTGIFADVKEAAVWFRKASAQGNNNSINELALLGTENSENLNEAFKYLYDAIELSPNDDQLKDTLEWLTFMKGQYKFTSIKGNKIELRSGPAPTYSIQAKLPDGYPLKRLETKGDWVKTEDFKGDIGWVNRTFLGNKHFLIVNEKRASIHNAPGYQYGVIAVANYGSIFEAVNYSDGWISVKQGSEVELGWIAEDLLWGW